MSFREFGPEKEDQNDDDSSLFFGSGFTLHYKEAWHVRLKRKIFPHYHPPTKIYVEGEYIKPTWSVLIYRFLQWFRPSYWRSLFVEKEIEVYLDGKKLEKGSEVLDQ